MTNPIPDIIATWSPVRTCAGLLSDSAVMIVHGGEATRPFWRVQAERNLREIAAAMGFRLVPVEGGAQ